MTAQQSAEQWILSKCGGLGETVWIDLPNEALPSGLSLAVIRSAMWRMNQEGHVDCRLFEPHNAVRQMKLTRLK